MRQGVICVLTQLAQDRYAKGRPQPLLDRVRETTIRIALCRKRSVRRD